MRYLGVALVPAESAEANAGTFDKRRYKLRAYSKLFTLSTTSIAVGDRQAIDCCAGRRISPRFSQLGSHRLQQKLSSVSFSSAEKSDDNFIGRFAQLTALVVLVQPIPSSAFELQHTFGPGVKVSLGSTSQIRQ